LARKTHILNFPRCDTDRLGIYPIVDSIEWITRLLKLGIKTIQFRSKDQKQIIVEPQIAEVVRLSEKYRARLFINDYWHLAIQYRAYGVHLGQGDLDTADLHKISRAGLRLGISTHSCVEVYRAVNINPSYIALGPIFATTSKQMPFEPQGINAVKKWVRLLGNYWPLVAIGGINTERVAKLKKTGVGSVAVITAITEAQDYIKTTVDLMRLWKD